MNITTSEIYRLQKVLDFIKTIIIIADKAQRENFNSIENVKITNLLENTTAEIYLINQQILERNNHA